MAIPMNLLQGQLQNAFAAFNAGRTDEAERAALKILKLRPKEPNALYLLGILSHQSGDLKTASKYFEKSYKSDSRNAGALTGLGIVRLDQKRGAEAEKLFRTALKHQAGDPALMNNLGLALKLQDRMDPAMRAFQEAVRIDPSYSAAQINIGSILKYTRGPEVVLKHYKTLYERYPNDVEIGLQCAIAYSNLSKVPEAIEILDRVVSKAPDFARAVAMHASFNINLGNFEKAESLYRRAIALEPGNSMHTLELAELLDSLGKDRKEEAIALTREAIAAFESEKNDEQFPLARLSKGYERLGQYDKAFPCFMLAQSRRKSENASYGVVYDRAEVAGMTDELIELFASGADLPKSDCTTRKPIFVIGLPRSGTTLLDRILGSDPKIHGAGELHDFPIAMQPYLEKEPSLARVIERFSVADLNAIADSYLSAVEALAPDADHVVDKLPSNFLNAGLLRMVFPNCTIIHTKRSLLDTAVSIFTQYFSNELVFDHDLKDIGHYARQYVRLMRCWHQWDTQMFSSVYEELVENPEAVVSPILQSVGLAWRDDMTEFHKSKGAVLTASRLQVRQPIYKTAKAKWRRYEKYLGPLLAELGPLADPSMDIWGPDVDV